MTTLRFDVYDADSQFLRTSEKEGCSVRMTVGAYPTGTIPHPQPADAFVMVVINEDDVVAVFPVVHGP